MVAVDNAYWFRAGVNVLNVGGVTRSAATIFLQVREINKNRH